VLTPPSVSATLASGTAGCEARTFAGFCSCGWGVEQAISAQAAHSHGLIVAIDARRLHDCRNPWVGTSNFSPSSIPL
jgi:hypothetical protein